MKIIASLYLAMLLPTFTHAGSSSCGESGDLCFSQPCCSGYRCSRLPSIFVISSTCVRTRNLREYTSSSSDETKSDWDDLKETCTGDNTSYYELALSAGHHIMLLAKPVTADRADCRPFMMHDDSNSDIQNGKEVIVMDETDDFFLSKWKESHSMGNYSLEALSTAFDAAESLGQEQVYDLVQNNCANFVLSVAEYVKYTMDDSMFTYVVESLAKSDIPDHLRNSTSALDVGLIGGHDSTNDNISMVRKLVSLYLEEHSKDVPP